MATNSLAAKLQESVHRFSTVEPILCRWLGGRILPIDACRDHPTLLDLDRAGVDFLHVGPDNWRRFGAFREQGCRLRPFNTFTIRTERESGARTELEKLLEAPEGAVRPSYHVQAYFSLPTGELLSVALIETTALVAMLRAGRYSRQTTGARQSGQAVFSVLPWADIHAAGYPIRVHTEPTRRRFYDDE